MEQTHKIYLKFEKKKQVIWKFFLGVMYGLRNER